MQEQQSVAQSFQHRSPLSQVLRSGMCCLLHQGAGKAQPAASLGFLVFLTWISSHLYRQLSDSCSGHLLPGHRGLSGAGSPGREPRARPVARGGPGAGGAGRERGGAAAAARVEPLHTPSAAPSEPRRICQLYLGGRMDHMGSFTQLGGACQCRIRSPAEKPS